MRTFLHLVKSYGQFIVYAICLALLLFLLKWLELRFIIVNHSLEIYVSAIAVIFTGLGIWLALKLARPRIKTVVVEREVVLEKGSPVMEKEVLETPQTSFALNQQALDKLGISQRELEVLTLMQDGLSNQEIAARLFVSPNTIKTHAANLFEKLDVKRRTQAIGKAQMLGLVAVAQPKRLED